jgi:hypothetical protein
MTQMQQEHATPEDKIEAQRLAEAAVSHVRVPLQNRDLDQAQELGALTAEERADPAMLGKWVARKIFSYIGDAALRREHDAAIEATKGDLELVLRIPEIGIDHLVRHGFLWNEARRNPEAVGEAISKALQEKFGVRDRDTDGSVPISQVMAPFRGTGSELETLSVGPVRW